MGVLAARLTGYRPGASLLVVPKMIPVTPLPVIDWVGDHCAFATAAAEMVSAAAWLNWTVALVGFQSTLTWTATVSPGRMCTKGGESVTLTPADGVLVGVP